MVLVAGMALGAPTVARASFGGDNGFTSVNPLSGVVMSGGEGIVADNQFRAARRRTAGTSAGTPQWLRDPSSQTAAPAAGRLRKMAAARAAASAR